MKIDMAELAPGATAPVVEPVLFGRLMMGEAVERGLGAGSRGEAHRVDAPAAERMLLEEGAHPWMEAPGRKIARRADGGGGDRPTIL